ncbi:uncharacterized protein MELLADRAFT_92398 [Melampsora larici-populina 98AG31]|uniref:RNase H type-1 domain-containing protein n=1 Tax=Melampsora larici-populina (strain 98AG31 / pathotype 3-4-7) TaxID=747676 RepID=F4R9H6_MELLP|nr:uncharacterized protein MELLADRAFT_92398 [Melampsora larici-populina 98AG31]EGG11151.1 hypothetical protein MELLADRAFT_92398 [Melampsora larici-populina 98AG31]
MASGKEKGLEVSKFLTQENDDLAEWEHYFRIFKKATKMAFPDCGKFISEYSKYIKSQFWSGGIRANWRNIADYNAAFRNQVADRRYVCFADWNHKDFDVLKTQFFGSAYDQRSSNLVAPSSFARYNQPFVNPVASSLFSRPAVQAPSRRKGALQAGPSTSKPATPGAHYTPEFKHKNGLGITSAKGVKHAEQYCFAYNSPENCSFSDADCSRLHLCRVVADQKVFYRMSGDVVQNTADAITPEEYTSERYLRGYQWDGMNPLGFSAAIESSLTAEPFPDAPSLEEDEDAAFALKRFHYLFTIQTPFNIDKMEQLLKFHPNQPFVKSAIKGLREGFWPSSRLPSSEIVDIPNHKTCFENQELLEKQCEEEIAKGRYSEEFLTLLPGMKVIPLLMTSKKDSDKMRVCSNMSFGKPSPNDLIDKDKIKVSYDSLQLWMPFLIELKKKHGDVTIFKSNVEGAFRTLPAHLQYQIRQVLRIKKKFRIDHNLTFGSSASPHIWCGVFSLVLWIAEEIFHIKSLNCMMDDVWSAAAADDWITFKDHRIPGPQAKLLMVFDILGVPWVWKKQVHGSVLEIIGHIVDSKKMSVYLEADKKLLMIDLIKKFVSTPSHSLRDWQSMQGWISWGFNSMPLGRFALQSLYEKTGGKTERFLSIHLNKENQGDLWWLIDYFESCNGVLVLKSSTWSALQADSLFYVDACPTGIGVWEPGSRKAYYHKLPLPSRHIFWAELLAVLAAIDLGINAGSRRIYVQTDNKNVFHLFNSHRPNQLIRPLFRYIVQRMVDCQVEVKVAHIAGLTNTCADLLSHSLTDAVKREFYPSSISLLKIDPVLGAGGIEINLEHFNNPALSWRRDL